jgi:hypothetical protein
MEFLLLILVLLTTFGIFKLVEFIEYKIFKRKKIETKPLDINTDKIDSEKFGNILERIGIFLAAVGSLDLKKIKIEPKTNSKKHPPFSDREKLLDLMKRIIMVYGEQERDRMVRLLNNHSYSYTEMYNILKTQYPNV